MIYHVKNGDFTTKSPSIVFCRDKEEIYCQLLIRSINKELWVITARRVGAEKDDDGYYHRKISGVGNFKVNNVVYYFDQNRAGQEILIQITENVLRVHDRQKILLGTLDKRMGRKYI